MRLAFALVAGSLLIAGCEPTPPEPVTEPLAVAPEAAEDWEGTWTFEETWPGSGEVTNAMEYTLVMGRYEGELEGGVGVDGYQTASNYDVRGATRGDTLDVTVSGYGEGDVDRRIGLGERLFSLVASGDGYVTVWDALTPAVSESEAGRAFAREEMD